MRLIEKLAQSKALVHQESWGWHFTRRGDMVNKVTFNKLEKAVSKGQPQEPQKRQEGGWREQLQAAAQEAPTWSAQINALTDLGTAKLPTGEVVNLDPSLAESSRIWAPWDVPGGVKDPNILDY